MTHRAAEQLLSDSYSAEAPELRWYLFIVTGVIGLIVGVLVLAQPDLSLKTLAVIAGVYLLLAGVLAIVRTVGDDERGAGGLLVGILALIAGVVVIRHPGQSVVAVSLALGIYFLVVGALALARAIAGPRRLFSLARGVVLTAAGVVITSSPEISVKTLALLTGIALLLQGAIQIGEGLVMRSLDRRSPA